MINEIDNVNVRVDLFMDGLQRLYNECFPIRWKSMSQNRMLNLLVTNKFINIINTKFSRFKQYKLGHISFQYYNYLKNKVTTMLKRAKKKYFEEKFDRCSGDKKIPGNY